VTTWMHANGASVTSARLLAKPKSTDQQSTMVTMAAVQARACTILVEFERARTELVGKAVILTNGKAGTVDRLWLDEFHGLRISIRSQAGNWPVSTIKSCGAVGSSGRYAQQSCGGASKTAMGQSAKYSRMTSGLPLTTDIVRILARCKSRDFSRPLRARSGHPPPISFLLFPYQSRTDSILCQANALLHW
jgi:hypothetical protein